MPRVQIEQLADWGLVYGTTRSLTPGKPEEFYSVGDDTWFRITVLPEDDQYAAAITKAFRR